MLWRGRGLELRDVATGASVGLSPDAVTLLGAFDRPRSAAEAARVLPQYRPQAVAAAVRALARMGALLPAGAAATSRVAAFGDNVASALYHAACRDLRFLEGEAAIARFLRAQVATKPRPPRHKRVTGAAGARLPFPAEGSQDGHALDRLLHARRTTRDFSRRAVSLEDLAAVVRGTWGQTGWLVDPVLGRLVAKTSPSAGALHPIEAYVLAWNVRGLRPGAYHYDVAGDSLRRVRGGNPREAAIRAASGQRWVGGAAFLCVMTAVFARTLWKYRFESAYRTLWLDAGHLGQTFSLLATARGLGPFTTAAIQDTHVERLLRLDGAREFPVYLCGAGAPPRARNVRARPRPAGKGAS
jgi:SagB-type dehydrogenase family enzyme